MLCFRNKTGQGVVPFFRNKFPGLWFFKGSKIHINLTPTLPRFQFWFSLLPSTHFISFCWVKQISRTFQDFPVLENAIIKFQDFPGFPGPIWTLIRVGSTVASWLVPSTLEWAVQRRAWLGTLCCVLGQDTLPTQCLSPPRCINGYQRT